MRSLNAVMWLRYKIVVVGLAAILVTSCTRDQITQPIPGNTLPDIPANLQVFGAQDGAIGIEWDKNTDASQITYKIYRSINNTNNFKYLTSTTSTYFVDDSLEYDSTYYYRISAVNSAGMESALSDYVSAKPINLYPPLPPTLVHINARNWTNTPQIFISWDPPIDTDVKGYNIYRSTADNFDADSAHLVAFTKTSSYTDTKNLSLLTTYYYKICAVDKGNLKSTPTYIASDLILNSPSLIFPADNSTLTQLTKFRFMAASKPAKYKLVIQTNIVYGVVQEFNFSSDQVDQVITVDASGLSLDPFRSYVWRVYTYTSSDTDPNSFSDYFSFTYNPNQ